MLKVIIWPSFINRCTFEIKESDKGWTFILAKDAYEHYEDKGNIWFSGNPDEEKTAEIIHLATSIINNPTPEPKRLLLDGVQVEILLRENEQEQKYQYVSPPLGTPELEIVEKLIKLAENEFTSSEAINYLELLEPYFYPVKFVKEFHENPFRLKVYGQLTVWEKDILNEKFAELKKKNKAILDMSNFLWLGRLLDECFLSLKDMEGLTIWVNRNAAMYLEELGFDKSKTIPVESIKLNDHSIK